MKKQPRRSSFITRVQNSQFRRLFFKNWLLVILCVILPLLVCSLISQYVSRKNLMQELDTSSQRSVRNTKATLQSLLDEAMDTLEIQSRDLSILTFLQQPRFSPSDYDFVIEAGDILSRISRDERRSLYDSVDAYSQFSNYLVSTLYRVQAYERIPDQSLVDTFSVYQEEHPRQTLFAQTRTSSYLGQQKHLITLYRIVAVAEQQKAFVSLSIDTDKLGQYLADELFPDQSAYLIVDASNRVILDTTHRLVGESLVLPTANQLVSSMNGKIGDENVRIAWTDVGEFGWQFVQLIPLSEFEATMRFEQNTINLVLLFSVLLSMLLSYLTTKKLFRPVEAILSILENPSNQQINDANGEINMLLTRILDLFEKNIALENQAIERVHALRRARSKALQEQMTPHFINNVLQVINWLAISETGNDNSRTSQSIILLADILDEGKKQKYSLVTVADEITYTKKFLELERLRYGDGIVCHFDIAPEAAKKLIPGISLQTLVENSVAHGFSARAGHGNIYVSIHDTPSGGLHIQVDDDGEGIEQATVDKLFSQLEKDFIYAGEHVGLINFFQRFLLIYGEDCRFDIRKSEYGGACVEVITPALGDEWLDSMDAGGEENAESV